MDFLKFLTVFFTLVNIQFILAGIANKVELSKMECKINPDFVKDLICNVNDGKIHYSATSTKEVPFAYMYVEAFRKNGDSFDSLKKIQLDSCKMMSGKGANLFEEIGQKILFDVSDFRGQCPYKVGSTLTIDNVSPNPAWIANTIPPGEYRVDLVMTGKNADEFLTETKMYAKVA